MDPANIVASSRVTGAPSENHRICSQRPQKVKVSEDEPVSMSIRLSRVPQQTYEMGVMRHLACQGWQPSAVSACRG
jgi:hypothetical protein